MNGEYGVWGVFVCGVCLCVGGGERVERVESVGGTCKWIPQSTLVFRSEWHRCQGCMRTYVEFGR